MFTWLNKQGVKHLTKNFQVQATGRFTTEYREDNQTLTLYTEVGESNGRWCEIILRKNLEKWDNGTSIQKDKQQEILQNYIEAMDFQGLGVIVEDKNSI